MPRLLPSLSCRPRRTPHLLAVLALAGLTLLTTGCERARPKPVAHAQLHIAADGSLTLDRVPVPLAQLQATLEQRTHDQPIVMVEIHASPQADMGVIKQASQAIEAAHARLSFADEVPASAPASSALAPAEP